MSQKIVFEKVQNFEENTTEYATAEILSDDHVKAIEEQIYQRYASTADFANKLERIPEDNGRLRLRVKTEPESLVYSKTQGGTSFIVQCEDFDVKWHVSNILQITLAMAGYEIKDTKF